MKISELLGDTTDPVITPRPPDLHPEPMAATGAATAAPATAARARLAELAVDLTAPVATAPAMAPEATHATPFDTSPALDDGGMSDLATMMGAPAAIAEAEGDDLDAALDPAMDDLLPALRKRTGPRGAARSGSRRRER